MTLLLLVFIGALVAYANGSNDNFKGVATLMGSGTASFPKALAFGTGATLLGSLTAVVLARGLLAAFTGKGLVPPEVVAAPVFPISVALAAGLTVLAASRLGFPISTTHALIGALVGAGLLASPSGVDTAVLASGFLLPLLTSPVVAVLLSALLYPLLRAARVRTGISQETCVCVGEEVVGVVPGGEPSVALRSVALPVLETGTVATCRIRYRGSVLGVSARGVLDAAHYASAGAVSFARGLNDTPKIAALLLVGGSVSPTAAIVGVGAAMALGGLLGARRVAHTMSHRVTEMGPGQGFTANLVTSILVIGASRLGVPVSTTHVSCGSLFGIGAVTNQAYWSTIARILLAWLVTLPAAALLAAGFVRGLGPLFA